MTGGSGGGGGGKEGRVGEGREGEGGIGGQEERLSKSREVAMGSRASVSIAEAEGEGGETGLRRR